MIASMDLLRWFVWAAVTLLLSEKPPYMKKRVHSDNHEDFKRLDVMEYTISDAGSAEEHMKICTEVFGMAPYIVEPEHCCTALEEVVAGMEARNAVMPWLKHAHLRHMRLRDFESMLLAHVIGTLGGYRGGG